MFSKHDLSLVFNQEILHDAKGQVIIDTRSGDCQDAIFFGLIGEKCDGSIFAAEAFKCGAKICVVNGSQYIVPGFEDRCVVVEDTLNELWSLASYIRKKTKATIIAVTGSIGKTTTKCALKTVLSEFDDTHVSVASYNNKYGLALVLANTPCNARYIVLEIGMGKAGDIRNLVKLAKPHISIITTIAPAHLESFSSIEEIAYAKAEIFEHTTHTAILDCDDEYYPLLSGIAKDHNLKIVTFGATNDQADFQLLQERYSDKINIEGVIQYKDSRYSFASNLPEYCLKVLAIVAAVCHELDLNLEKVLKILKDVTPVSGRGNVINLVNNIKIIDSSYNASPQSMKMALYDLSRRQGGRKIACIGEMLGLGPFSLDMHIRIAALLDGMDIQVVYTVGSISQVIQSKIAESRRGQHFETSEELGLHLIKAIQANDIILFKGSNSINLIKTIEMLQEGII